MYNVYKTKQFRRYLKDDTIDDGAQFTGMHFGRHAIVVGPTGSGKTSWLCNLIFQSDRGRRKQYEHIVIVTAAQEVLYTALKDMLGERLTFVTNLADLELDEGDHAQVQRLVVFDDMITADSKSMKRISDIFIRGRKMGAGISAVFLAQSFFKIDKLIRAQASYLIFLKIASVPNLKRIFAEFDPGIEVPVFMRIFRNAVREQFSVFKVDTRTNDLNRKFARGWTEFYRVADEGNEPLPLSQVRVFEHSAILN